MSKLRRKFIAVLAVLFCALLALSTALFIPTNKTAGASSTDNGLNVGNLINSGTGTNISINRSNLTTLYARLTGNSNATFSTVKGLVSGGATLNGQEIRAKASGKTATVSDTVGEFTVNVGGMDWIPTYLSKNSDNEVILTLWLAQSSLVYSLTGTTSGKLHEWGAFSSVAVSDTTLACSMYSTSKIRSYLVGSKYASVKNQTTPDATSIQYITWSNFINNYGNLIATPETVEWQKTQSAITDRERIDGGGGMNYNTVNECWGVPSSNPSTWSGNSNKAIYNNTYYYGAWKEDKLWLPSMTETGCNDKWYGLWRLSKTQLKNPNYAYWLRTGGSAADDNIKNVCYISPKGNINDADVTVTIVNDEYFTARPAFHLNLTKAEYLLPAPKDVENTYNGSEQKLADLTEKPDWYSEYLTVYSSNMTVEYPTTNDGDMLNATDSGYEVKVTISSGSDYRWADGTDGSIPKTFKFKITKKKVKVKFTAGGNVFLAGSSVPSDENGTNYPTAEFDSGQIANDDAGTDRCPKIKTKYQNSYVPPTTPGNYTASAELEYEAGVPQNYELDTTTSSINFTVTAREITVPTLSGESGLTYDGDEHTVTVTNHSSDIKYAVYRDDGTKIDSIDGTAQTFIIKDAGDYKVTFSLADDEACTWKNKNSSAPFDEEFTVEKREITLTLTGDDEFKGGSWSKGSEKKFEISIAGAVGGEDVQLYVYLTKKDGSGKQSLSATDGKYTISGSLFKGEYILYCELTDPSADSGNEYKKGNYKIKYAVDGKLQTAFEVTSSQVKPDEIELEWGYKIEGDNAILSFGEGNKVTYNGKDITVILKTTDNELADMGVKREGTLEGATTRKNANGVYDAETVYTVTVKLVAYSEDFAFEGATITFNWYISKAQFDLSSLNSVVKWGYTARDVTYTYDKTAGIQYEGGGPDGNIVLAIKEGLPDWLTPNYGGVCSGSAVKDDYIAKILSFDSSNDNYELIEDDANWLELPWKIVPRTLSTDKWTAVQYENGAVTVPPTLIIMTYNPYIKYAYYEDEDRSGTPITDYKQLTYAEGSTAVYYAWAYIDESEQNNWILSEKGDNPHYFEIGKAKQAVEITITAGGTYDGTAQNATIEIVRGAEGITLESFDIKYYKSDDTEIGSAPVNAGNYYVIVTLKEDFTEGFYIKSGDSQTFEIKKRVLEVPKYDGSLTYDGAVRDVAKLCGLPDGWENYIDITIAGTGGNTDTVVKNMGRYSVTFSIKNGINTTDIRNVEWNTDSSVTKTLPQIVYIDVEQLELNAKSWHNNKYYSRIEFEEENAENFLVYKVYNENGAEVDYGTVLGSVGEMFTVEVTVGTEHGDNVVIKFASGVSARFEFYTDGGQTPTEVALPTIADLTFNGENQTFVVNYGEFEQYIELDLSLSDVSVLTQFNAGEYTVYFKIKSGQNAVWADTGDRKSIAVTFKMKVLVLDEPQVKSGERFTYSGSAQSATLNIDAAILARFMKIEGDYTATNAGDYTFTLSIDPSFAGNVVWASAAQGVDTVKTVDWTIEKARVSVKWTQSGDVPELDIPEEFKDLDVEYEIRDENGSLVTPDQMEAGKTYTVTAKLKEGSAANYEFVDDSGKSLTNPATTDGMKFEYSTGVDDGSSFPWWILAVAAGALLLILALIIIVVKKRQTADGEDFDDYYGDDYDYDEEEEIDDFDDEDF